MYGTSEQIRAARVLLRLGQADLARRAHVSVLTIRRLEGVDGREWVAPGTLEGICRVLELVGAEFIPNGVCCRSIGTNADALHDDLRAISQRSAATLQGHTLLTDTDLYDADGLPS